MDAASLKLDVELSKEAQQVLHIAQRKAVEYAHASFGGAHLLWALLNKEISTYQLVRKWDKDIFYLQEWASVRLEEYPKANGTVSEPEASPTVHEILNEADQLSFENGRKEVDAVCLLAVVCIPGLVFSYDQLKTFTLSKDEILRNAKGDASTSKNGIPSNITPASQGTGPTENILNEFCRDKHQEVLARDHFHLIERKEEVKTCMEVLSRYAKANLIIIGESGVGKTALIDGLVEQIASGGVPKNLADIRILELDMAAIQAGASYKGELEDRFQKIATNLENLEKPVLVIEDIHRLLEKKNTLSSLASLLMMKLNRGRLTVIGTCTPENFRKNIEKDETFTRRFETLTLNEPSDDNTTKIIQTVTAPHRNHHNLQIDDDTIREAIRLAKRYDKERRLPDAAIDLIDRCMARVRITLNKTHTFFETLKNELDQYKHHKDKNVTALREKYAILHDASARLMKNHYKLKLKNAKSLDNDSELVTYLTEIIGDVGGLLEDGPEGINESDLAEIVSRKTGIPTGKIKTQERKRLLGMENVLRKRVVGQDAALKSVTEAVLESRSGLLEDGQPIGSFFFLGPTGTGKTELAKALSEFLFQDEQAMIRFDMSEFKEEHSAAMLYGSPPGYVGYEEGGMLVNKIREKPYSVVLFDEIEKAHASVFDIFLQILDEGKLNDRLGKEGDFSNSVILFTSNIASKSITAAFRKDGRLPSSQTLMEELSGYFRPEFLGRLTEIVPFAPISEEVLLRIFDINMANFLKTTTRKGINIELNQEVKQHLAQLGYSPQYGARPLKGVIRDKIRRPLSRMLIDGSVEAGHTVQLSLGTENQLDWNIN